MELFLNEQDIVDSVCVFTAAREYTNPENIDVELAYHPSYGISADARCHGRTRNLNEQDVIDAVAVYLSDYHNFEPHRLLVELSFTEGAGITASVQLKEY